MLIYQQETLLGTRQKLNVQSWKGQGVQDESKTEKNESTSEIHCEFSLAAGKHISGTLLLISETDGALSRVRLGVLPTRWPGGRTAEEVEHPVPFS